MEKIVVIIQARMGSTRLRGKTLKKILNRPLLFYVVQRCRQAKLIDNIVVCTSDQPQDQAIVEFCKKEQVRCVKGSEQDVLARYKKAAKDLQATVIVRITADCPLVDPDIIDRGVEIYQKNSFDYVSNCVVRSYPRGFDVEVFGIDPLLEACEKATFPEEREHVTLYFLRHPDHFFLGNFIAKEDESNLRVTVDTEEDFLVVQKIFTHLYPKSPFFGYEEVIDLLKRHPEWVKINAHIEQKKV